MVTRKAHRIEIVRSSHLKTKPKIREGGVIDHGWHEVSTYHWRQVAGNGQILTSSETFTRRRDAERSLLAAARGWWEDQGYEWDPRIGEGWLIQIREGWQLRGPNGIAMEVRHIDERQP